MSTVIVTVAKVVGCLVPVAYTAYQMNCDKKSKASKVKTKAKKKK